LPGWLSEIILLLISQLISVLKAYYAAGSLPYFPKN
jgi:hypothetical protein